MKRKLTFVFLLLSALWSPVTRANVYSDYLFSNKAPSMLAQGDSFDMGKWVLVMQTDGNLVFYRKAGMVALWSTGTNGTGDYAVIQGDGNFVVYTKAGQAVWSTGSYGPAGVYLLSSETGGKLIILRVEDGPGNYTKVWSSPPDPAGNGCPGGSNPQAYPVCIGGMTFNLPMCSQADASVYAHQQGGYYGACH